MKQFSQLTSGYTKVPNALLNDPFLSWKAKGLFCHMASKPDNWVFSVQRLAKSYKDGKTAIFAALNELKARGWVQYFKNANGSGQYILATSLAIKPKAVKRDLEKPKAENPVLDNPMMGKSDAINKKESNSNKDIYKEGLEKSQKVINLGIDKDQPNPSTRYTEQEILVLVQQGVINVH